MTFIKFINQFVEDAEFKKTINALYEVWQRENMVENDNPTFESAITPQPQQTVSTANTPEQNAAVQQGQQKPEPKTITGDLNKLSAEQLDMTAEQFANVADRVKALNKVQEENEKATQQAKENIDKDLDTIQQTFNAVANGQTNNVVG